MVTDAASKLSRKGIAGRALTRRQDEMEKRGCES